MPNFLISKVGKYPFNDFLQFLKVQRFLRKTTFRESFLIKSSNFLNLAKKLFSSFFKISRKTSFESTTGSIYLIVAFIWQLTRNQSFQQLAPRIFCLSVVVRMKNIPCMGSSLYCQSVDFYSFQSYCHIISDPKELSLKIIIFS